jgi:hypothetical protein
MTRRKWLQCSSAFLALGARASAQTLLSTRGDFLDWSPEEERYWFFGARDGLKRFRQLAFAHPDACELREIARSAGGMPVYAFRIGHGNRSLALLSGMHGPEPSGPRGLLAYLDAVLNGSRPFGLEVERQEFLRRLTLYIVPLMNPGGTQRFSEHFPDAWHGTWLRGWTEPNKTRFFAEGNEPLHFFYGTYIKKPPMRFTAEQIAKWEATGNVLGSSLTDAGLDMWFDWAHTHGVETHGVKALLAEVHPHCIVDFHNFMFPTEVFAPTVYSRGTVAAEEQALARAVQKSWRGRKLLFHDRPPRPYPKPTEKYYEDYWFHEQGARALIIEINGGMLATEGAEYEPTLGERPLTRRESLETVVAAVDALAREVAGAAAAH